MRAAVKIKLKAVGAITVDDLIDHIDYTLANLRHGEIQLIAVGIGQKSCQRTVPRQAGFWT